MARYIAVALMLGLVLTPCSFATTSQQDMSPFEGWQQQWQNVLSWLLSWRLEGPEQLQRGVPSDSERWQDTSNKHGAYIDPSGFAGEGLDDPKGVLPGGQSSGFVDP